MHGDHFPPLIRELPLFDGPFEAFRLEASDCQVLFASYPAGTTIDTHTHPSRNCGVITRGALYLTKNGRELRYAVGDWYTIDANEEHAARFEEDTSEIEFWFD